MIDELPPELRELIAAERQTLPSSAVRTAVRAKLGATVGKAAVGAGLGAGAIKIISIIALITTGAGVAKLASSDDPALAAGPVIAIATRDSIIDTEPRATSATFEPMPVASTAPPREPIARPDLHVEPVVIDDRLPTPGPVTESETIHLGRALRALSVGDASTALALVDEHHVLYPLARLGEERDALGVQALALLGRAGEARISATRFLAAHPHSIHVATIRKILKESP